MKFSVRQILASAAGAVLAALIASSFGVKGTIVGVAIGSVAATLGTALVAQSIERGQDAMKQVVVRAPDSSMLRRLGGTSASGDPQATVGAGSAPTERIPATSGSGTADGQAETMESTPAVTWDTRRLEVSAVADAPATERLRATTLPARPARPAGPAGRAHGGAMTARRFSWKAIAGTAGVVFLVALLFVTAVELISGKPLSSIFGDHGSGPSIKQIFVPSSPAPSPASTTTTTTTAVPPSTTTTTAGAGASSSTTTTLSTTTTTAPSGNGSTTTTTTTGPGGTGTTTTAPGGTTSSSAPG